VTSVYPFAINIGITEILGAIGIILPYLLNIYPGLTAIASLYLGFIMMPASIIHYNLGKIENRQKENNNATVQYDNPGNLFDHRVLQDEIKNGNVERFIRSTNMLKKSEKSQH
jgi:hypothetical protein